MKKILFILFGAPGSGKGYLGECLRQEFLLQKLAVEKDILYISTGDLLRAEMAERTPLGLEITETMNAGGYVSDDIVDALVKKALHRSEPIKFLDGYPRTFAQLQYLQQILIGLNVEVIAVKRETPIPLILERVSQRRGCQDCKTTHSVKDGKCPKCGGPSVIRADDALINRRLTQYKNCTAGLWEDLAVMSSDWWLVDGTQDAVTMARRILLSFL